MDRRICLPLEGEFTIQDENYSAALKFVMPLAVSELPEAVGCIFFMLATIYDATIHAENE